MSAQSLIVEHLPVGLLQCNCVILGDPETGRALVIDPGDDVARIAAVLERLNLSVTAILATHAHIDHVGGLAQLAELTGARTMLHEADVPLYDQLEIQAQFLGVPAPQVARRVDAYVGEGSSVDFGRRKVEIVHTPGHTPGSIVLAAAGNKAPLVLSGDTLFAGSIGRTDLWGGSYEEIMRSLRTKVLALPDEAVVLPGHGPETTIGVERRTNPFLVAS